MTTNPTTAIERALKPFQREERYIVIKRKHLSAVQERSLQAHMTRLGIGQVESAVVERDWPEYEPVWQMIEDRVTGRATLSQPTEQPENWIIANSAGDRWRVWRNGNIEWTEHRGHATRYVRREDAEAVHAEDEDAWRVEPYRTVEAQPGAVREADWCEQAKELAFLLETEVAELTDEENDLLNRVSRFLRRIAATPAPTPPTEAEAREVLAECWRKSGRPDLADTIAKGTDSEWTKSAVAIQAMIAFAGTRPAAAVDIRR